MYGKQWNIISISNPNWLKRFWKWQKRRFSYFVLTTPKTGKCTTKYHHLKFAIASANIFSAPGHTHTQTHRFIGWSVLVCCVKFCIVPSTDPPPARMKSINFDFDNIEWFIVSIFVKEKNRSRDTRNYFVPIHAPLFVFIVHKKAKCHSVDLLPWATTTTEIHSKCRHKCSDTHE